MKTKTPSPLPPPPPLLTRLIAATVLPQPPAPPVAVVITAATGIVGSVRAKEGLITVSSSTEV